MLLLVHTTVTKLTLSTITNIYNVRSINLKAIYMPLLKNACILMMLNAAHYYPALQSRPV